MVKVCDAIMGTGKSSAAITYMSEHPEQKFIYITPYLEEAKRITVACRGVRFVEPRELARFSGSKIRHTYDLVKKGENIATTHQAFLYYPKEMLALIKERKYTLVIDENVNVMETIEEKPADVQLAIDAGYIEESAPGVYTLRKDVYDDGKHKEFFRLLQTRDIVKVQDGKKKDIFLYWRFPPDLIKAFENVFILTYMFNGQELHHFLEMYKIPYEFIGVDYTDGVYRFSDTAHYVPAYVKNLPDMIHIVDNPRLNEVGNSEFALSLSWFNKNPEGVAKLKNNIYNNFRNYCRAPVYERMWGSFASAESKLRGKGYSKGFVTFNKKATNEFKDRTALAYCVNVFMNVGQKLFYTRNGVDVNEDEYALSVMVQWIWRSAIRDGREIWLYLPSKRMRELLINWMKEVSER